jgi:hypothetical protein
MLARDRLSLKQMSWMLVKVFFGYGGELSAPGDESLGLIV